MPIKQKDWAKILKALGLVGQTISGMEQLKQAQARQAEADEIRKIRLQNLKAGQAEATDVAQAKTDVDTLLQIAGMQGPVSVPFPEGGGGVDFTPTPEGILSGVNNVALEKAYERAYGKSLPQHLRIKEKPTPSASKMLTERKAQAELGVMKPLPSQLPGLTDTDKTILAHDAVAKGTASDLQKIRAKLHPFPGQKTTPELTPGKINSIRTLAKNQYKLADWEKMEFVDKIAAVNRVGRREYPKIWVDQTVPYDITVEFIDWGKDKKETIFLLPQTIKELKGMKEEIEKAQEKYKSGEWNYEDYVGWYHSGRKK
jgi:hypothetical protein